MFNFGKLEVWQKSVAFAALVYRVSRLFPADERFGLTDQIRRAAVSVGSNIAEGSARGSADFGGFLGYASGSIAEIATQATLCRNEGFVTSSDFDAIYRDAEEISRMLSGLRKSLQE